MELTRKFDELNKGDAHLAGGKGASLGEMTQAGIPVPPGFVVLAETFERFIVETDINVEIDNILHKVDPRAIHTVDAASEQIQSLVKNVQMPQDIADEILSQFDILGTEYVAVRSSATAEDSASAAWAGQLDSFLNTTRESVLKRVQDCWASLFTPRAIFYRFEKDLHNTKISVAVVVQKMVNSEKSGIAFSVHPVTEDRNQLIIEAGLGLGEAIVSGQITPDSYVVEKEPRRIIDINISEQTRGLFRIEGGGNEWHELGEKGNKQVLSEIEILELSEIILGIEGHYGFPCDIEWAYEGAKFYIVQSRPITTLQNLEISSKKVIVFKDKNEYLGLGRWVAPVIEYEAWMDWSNTEEAKALGMMHDNPAAVAIDGHYFLPKDGAYSKLREQISDEFKSGNFEVSNKILGLAEELSNECIAMAQNIKASPTFDDFIIAFDLMSKLRFPWMSCFPLGDAGEEFVNQYAEKNNIRVDEIGELIPQLMNSLTTDQQELSRFKEEIEKGKLSFDIVSIEKENSALADKIKEYQKKTEYIGTHHFWGDERSIERLMDAIKNASLESKNEKITESKIKAFEIIAEATKWRLECAQSSAVLAYAYRPFMTELAKKHDLTYDDLIFLVTSEIKDLMENKTNVTSLISERQKKMGILKVDGKIHVTVGEELHTWEKHFGLLDEHEAVEEFKGAIGNKGVVQGTVVIVLKPSDQSKVQPGMILVAPETTPDFIPSMGKAIAFITDQGGITSHAAIVAREMGKPCIIGTKIATKVLKDGDVVEVDADKGVVRILSNLVSKSEPGLSEKFLERLGSKVLYPPLNSYSLFIQGSEYNLDRYYGKWYDNTVSFDVFLLMREGFSQVWLAETDLRSASEFALKEFITDRAKYDLRQNLLQINSSKIDEIYNKYSYEAIKNTDWSKLFELTEEIKDIIWDTNAALIFSIYFDQDLCNKVLKDINFDLSPDKLTHLWLQAISPAFESFDKIQMKDVLTLLTSGANMEEIAEKSQYILTDYHSARDLTIIKKTLNDRYGEFINNPDRIPVALATEEHEVREATNGYQNWLITLDPSEKVIVEYIQLVMQTRDRRKNFFAKGLTIIYRIAERMFVEAGIERDLIPCYTMRELVKGVGYLKNNKERLEARKQGVQLFIPATGEVVLEEKGIDLAVEKVNQAFTMSHQQANEKELIGQIGSKGKSTGIVRVILDAQSNHNFQKGEILVTGMTRPEFVPLMKLAAGIITDEGGITCHAAIISRELGTPCVIGTKVATRILKDGDTVEVDADNGVIRILKTNEDSNLQPNPQDYFFLETVPSGFPMDVAYINLAHVSAPKIRYGFDAGSMYLVFENGGYRIFIEKDKWFDTGRKILTQVLTSDERVKEWKDRFNTWIQEIKLANKYYQDFNFTPLSNEAISNELEKILALENKNGLEGVEIVTTNYGTNLIYQELEKALKAAGVDVNQTMQIILRATGNFPLFEYEKEIGKLALKCHQESLTTVTLSDLNSNELLSRDVNALVKQYGWLDASLTNPPKSVASILGDINNLLAFGAKLNEILSQRDKEEIEKKLEKDGVLNELLEKLDDSQKRTVHFATTSAELGRILVDSIMEFIHYRRKIYSDISRRIDLTENQVKLMFAEEIQQCLLEDKKPNMSLIDDRSKLTVVFIRDDEIVLSSGEEAQKVSQLLMTIVQEDSSSLRGEIAFSGGKVQGIAKIVKDVTEMSKIEEGNILVSSRTYPDLLPAMKKSAAIVAELGGLLSHAAIVSRELKIPCVVGVKNAIAQIKDGDLIEVDSDKGIVRILEN